MPKELIPILPLRWEFLFSPDSIRIFHRLSLPPGCLDTRSFQQNLSVLKKMHTDFIPMVQLVLSLKVFFSDKRLTIQVGKKAKH